MEGKKITAEAARDIWAAEIEKGQDIEHRLGSSVTEYLIGVLEKLQKATGGSVVDTLGLFLRDASNEGSIKTDQVNGVSPGQISELRRSAILYCLVYCLGARETRIDLLKVAFHKALEFLLIERLKEWEVDGAAMDAGKDDLDRIFRFKGV